MADFNALETLINAYIKKNGVQAITGNILNGVLRGMVSALGKGYTIVGVATPSTDPGTLTGPCAYYASTYGTYTNFGNIVVNDGEIAMLIYDEAVWHKEVMFYLSAEASVDGNVGTPWVNASFENGMLTFTFGNLKGNTGDAAGFGTVNATVDSNIGTPGVSVQTSGPDTAKNMTFQFTNLKGETGVTSVVVTVDNTSGNPACAVSLNGQELHLDFTGLKGAQGDTGVSADYPIAIVNNLTTSDPTSALSAQMGVQLESEISQLELKVDGLEQTIDFSTAPYYVGNLSANGTWGNTTTYASKYSYFIIPYVQGAVVTITGNATNGTGIVYALDSYSTPSNGDTQTILGTYAPGANETISFVPPTGTIYIYVVRRYYDTTKDFTPALMKEKITGISESVEGLKENVGNIDDTLFGNEVSLMLTNYLYMNGTTIYTRANGFSVRYAQVKPGNYIVSFIGNGEITYADGVAVGYTTNAVANGNSYNPITKVEYRTGQLVEIPVTIPVESNIVIASWTAKVANLVVRRMEYSHEYYGSLIKYVGTDINKTYTSLDTALDSVVAGQKTAILVSTGTYTLSDDWTNTEIENASYSDVAAGVADSWCGTPVKDGTSIIGINGKDKVIIYAELPASTPTYNEISALNLMGDVTLRGVTISSRRMRYPIHDDFKLYNANKTHNIIDCNLISYGNTPAYGAARSSGETINVENCYIEGFAIHASYEFLLPAFVNIKDTTITYTLNIGDHNTKVECPFKLSNVNVGVISYYKNSESDPQYVVLSIRGGNLPVIKGIEKYSHDGIIYRTTLTAAVSKGSPVKSDGLLNCVTMASGDDATKFIGIAMDDYAKVDTQNNHDFYPFIAKGYAPTTLVGITTFAIGDTIGVVNGAVVVSSSNVIGEIEYIDSGVGYIRLY